MQAINLVAALVAAICPIEEPTQTADDPLAILGTVKVNEHQLVKLTATGGPAGAVYDWTITPEDRADVEENGGRIVFAAPPGMYVVKVSALALDGMKLVKRTARVTVVIDMNAPPMPPPPKDGKPPEKKGDPGKPNPAAALCKITRPVGGGRGVGCTTTIIGPRRADGRWDLITADHCGPRGSKWTVVMQDGRRFTATAQANDRDADLSWLTTDAADLGDLPFALMAAEHPPAGTMIWHAGYGVHIPGNRENGVVLSGPAGDGKFRMKMSVSSGDSGGGIFREDTGEWISAVCCTTRLSGPGTVRGGYVGRARELRPK